MQVAGDAAKCGRSAETDVVRLITQRRLAIVPDARVRDGLPRSLTPSAAPTRDPRSAARTTHRMAVIMTPSICAVPVACQSGLGNGDQISPRNDHSRPGSLSPEMAWSSGRGHAKVPDCGFPPPAPVIADPWLGRACRRGQGGG